MVVAIAVAVPGALNVVAYASARPGDPPPEMLPQSASSPQSQGVAVDPSPSTSPSDETAPVTVASGVDSRWHRTAVTVQLSATDDDSGVAATWFRVDGGAWKTGTKIVVAAPRNHGDDGQHAIDFYSVDGVGNTEAVQTVTVKIDTTPPKFSWRKVTPGVVYRTQSIHFRFTVREPSGAVRVGVTITDQYGHLVRRIKGIKRAPGARRVDLTPRYGNRKPFLPGLYRVHLTLVDQAGNKTVTKARVFRDYRPAKASVWRHVSGAGKRVALTFDDGGDGPWASMLRTLKAYHAHATFFPLGPWVNGALARKTIASGNAIGSHGWTHTDMTRQSYGGVRSELTRSIGPWWRAAKAVPVPYCRPPYGSYNSATLVAAGSAGFVRVILWDVDPRDWTEPGSGVIAQRVLSHVHSGAIVCMHLRPQTAAALPAILRGLRARGYKAVTIPELFRAAGYR
jgi:peptidoglycan/xylan/chitin deacetylase (PgdA/CDA1 family)